MTTLDEIFEIPEAVHQGDFVMRLAQVDMLSGDLIQSEGAVARREEHRRLNVGDREILERAGSPEQ